MTSELKSQSAEEPKSSQEPELDPKALAAIRDLLRSEPEEEPTLAPQATQAVPSQAEPAPVETAPVAHAAARPVPQQEAAPVRPAPEASPAKEAPGGGRIDRLKARVTGYRPTPKHIIIAACALVMLMRPWLVVGLLLLTIFVFIGVFLILGYDGFWKRAMGIARWYARRRPSRAAELHRKLDDFAMKWDAFLDRFPEGSVDGLYLPDFGELATADARHDEALDRRLSSLREGEA